MSKWMSEMESDKSLWTLMVHAWATKEWERKADFGAARKTESCLGHNESAFSVS